MVFGKSEKWVFRLCRDLVANNRFVNCVTGIQQHTKIAYMVRHLSHAHDSRVMCKSSFVIAAFFVSSGYFTVWMAMYYDGCSNCYSSSKWEELQITQCL